MVDYSFLTPRLAVGGGIWNRENLEGLLRAGFTHILNTQAEFDDRSLVDDRLIHPPVILWLPLDDDFKPKPAEVFEQAVEFVDRALEDPGAKVLVHCASGAHRAPMVALAVLHTMGFGRREAERLVRARRPAADFPEPYLDSVEAFAAEWDVRLEREA